jgi:hypothetical protein
VEVHRLRGDLLLIQETRQGSARTTAPGRARMAKTETCFQQSLAVVRRQEAKALELRAAVSLSRLWQQ